MFGRVLIVFAVALLVWAVVARSSSANGPERRYVVRPTDTLWSIAAAHGAGDPRSGVYELQRRNHLTGTTIMPGQVLVLP
jgi:LysM repeat protein